MGASFRSLRPPSPSAFRTSLASHPSLTSRIRHGTCATQPDMEEADRRPGRISSQLTQHRRTPQAQADGHHREQRVSACLLVSETAAGSHPPPTTQYSTQRRRPCYGRRRKKGRQKKISELDNPGPHRSPGCYPVAASMMKDRNHPTARPPGKPARSKAPTGPRRVYRPTGPAPPSAISAGMPCSTATM